jgi:hypothetical protein
LLSRILLVVQALFGLVALLSRGRATHRQGVLVGTGYGFLLQNEDGDVPGELIERLTAREQDFAAHGLDIGAIRSRVNI